MKQLTIKCWLGCFLLLLLIQNTGYGQDLTNKDNYIINGLSFEKTKDLNGFYCDSLKSNLGIVYSTAKQSKSYLLNKGNQFKSYSLTALWNKALDKESSFLATISFDKAEQDQIFGTSMLYNQDYGPYQLYHKFKADYHFQHYNINTQYKKQVNRFTFLAGISYTGNYSFTLTEPRNKAISSWLKPKVGVEYSLTKNSQVFLTSWYQHHRQTVELDVYNGNRKRQFLLLKGFGLYDHQHKDYEFSKKRIYSANSIGVNLGADLFQTNRFSLSLGFIGSIDKLKTQELNTIVLHELKTSKTLVSGALNYKANRFLNIKLKANYYFKELLGTENRYSYVNVNQDYESVYDYIKIAQVRPYILQNKQWYLDLGLQNYLSDKFSYVLGGGYSQTNFDEQYKTTAFKTLINKQIYKGYLRLDYQNKKNRAFLSFSYQNQATTSANSYKDTDLKGLYQEVYYPNYLYEKLNKKAIELTFDYSYRLKNNNRVALNIKLDKLWSTNTLNTSAGVFDLDYLGITTKLYYQF